MTATEGGAPFVGKTDVTDCLPGSEITPSLPNPPRKQSYWDEATDKLLTELWAEGYSAGAIAIKFGRGVTRNAVIGRVHRLKLKPRRTVIRNYRTSAPAKPAKKRGAISVKPKRTDDSGHASRLRAAQKRQKRLERLKAAPPLPIVKPPPADAWEPLPGSHPVDLEHLAPHQCKWPLGELPFLFCAEPAGELHPYCPVHTALAGGVGSKSEREAVQVLRRAA